MARPKGYDDEDGVGNARWKRREGKKRPKMPVDGAGVRDIGRIRKNRAIQREAKEALVGDEKED